MTTAAVTSMGAKVYVDTSSTTTPAWSEIKELKSYPQVGEGNPARLDATTLTSTSKEYIKDIPDMPELEFVFNAMPVSASDSNVKLVENTLDPTKSYNWKLVLPTLGITVTLIADWTWNITNGGVSQIPELTISLAGRSPMTVTEGTS